MDLTQNKTPFLSVRNMIINSSHSFNLYQRTLFNKFPKYDPKKTVIFENTLVVKLFNEF